MKINYIQNKTVDYNLVQKYLDLSKFKNHWTNNGPVKSLLEDKISEMINLPPGKKVLMAANGTVALHALMFYYDMKSGYDLKYISPSFTFPSCVVNESNTVVSDINDNYTIDQSVINGFDGVIITNLFGTICDFQAKDKLVIYDNASSFMSTYNNKNISLMGNASFSSLHHTKYLGFGEGGFLVINSKDYDNIQRILGFGFDVDRNHKIKSSNFKISDVSCAFILQHLERYNLSKHIENQQLFVDRLKNVLFNYSDGVVYGNIPVLFNSPIATDIFRERGIEANKYYKPLRSVHKNSLDLFSKIINLPLHEDLSKQEINYMCDVVEFLI